MRRVTYGNYGDSRVLLSTAKFSRAARVTQSLSYLILRLGGMLCEIGLAFYSYFIGGITRIRVPGRRGSLGFSFCFLCDTSPVVRVRVSSVHA